MTAEFYPGVETLGTTWSGTTAMSVGAPLTRSAPVSQTAAATGAGMPSPMTWFIGALVLLFLLKVASEHERSPLSPAHIHIGGYNVLTIFVIVVLSVVGMKLLVNRPFFNRGPQSGFAALVNAT